MTDIIINKEKLDVYIQSLIAKNPSTLFQSGWIAVLECLRDRKLKDEIEAVLEV